MRSLPADRRIRIAGRGAATAACQDCPACSVVGAITGGALYRVDNSRPSDALATAIGGR